MLKFKIRNNSTTDVCVVVVGAITVLPVVQYFSAVNI